MGNFSDKDKHFMKIALEEAKAALENGDYPIGAVLVIDGEIVGKKRNKAYSNGDWASHAELSLIKENSNIIKEKVKKNNSKVELFTTLEPCLMCLGASVFHRVSRIVFACHDPNAGASNIDPKNLTRFVAGIWPKIESGLYKEESYDMMVQFVKSKNWQDDFELLEEMRKKW